MTDKIILTPAEAESLLLDGDYVHNYVQGGFALLGCDFDRADAIAAFHSAVQIEIGGPACMSMKHPLVVWDTETHYSFFEADVDKVRALEASRADAEPSRPINDLSDDRDALASAGVEEEL